MLDALMLRLSETQSPAHVRLLRELAFSTLVESHKIVFTHGDFQAKNILVEKLEGHGESSRFKLTVIDWETSGWYPEYWEFCTAARSGRFRTDWIDTIQRIMPIYAKEFLKMHMIRSLIMF